MLSGRNLREIDFSAEEGQTAFKIGRFDAYDYFGNGSFYLLDAPGVSTPLSVIVTISSFFSSFSPNFSYNALTFSKYENEESPLTSSFPP